MGNNLSAHNDSNIQAFGTCTIPLILTVNRKVYDKRFYPTYHKGSVILSHQGSFYMQLVQSNPVFTNCLLKGEFFISSTHDRAYINIIKCNRKATHYQVHQRIHAPASKLAMPLGQPSLIDNTVPEICAEIRTKYGRCI